MKKKLLILLPLLSSFLIGCSNNDNNSTYDPFMIGDNLEVISPTEAQLIANEAYDNLAKTSSLRKSSTSVEDNTKFLTGALSVYATNTKSITDSEAVYYANKVDKTRNKSVTTYLGNDSTIEDRNTSVTEWYGIKPVKEGEAESTNYSLLTKTIEKYNGISSTRFGSTDDFATPTNVDAMWNRHLIQTIDKDYLSTNIAFSLDLTYVNDNQHTVGYLSKTEVTTESSRIAPGKEEVSYVKKVDSLVVVDFYRDEVLGIGWTVRTVSTRKVTTYLTTVDGKETDPIEVSRIEDTTSLFYDASHEKSEDIPEFELDTSIPFAISKFDYNEAHTGIEYTTKYDLENNDDYYSHFEDSFDGHAYYKEIKLDIGYYSFFDGEPKTPEDYEKWGYESIINNKCINYIVDPKTLPESEQKIITGHTKLFYVAASATFAFRIVFDAEMKEASEFSVAIIGA